MIARGVLRGAARLWHIHITHEHGSTTPIVHIAAVGVPLLPLSPSPRWLVRSVMTPPVPWWRAWLFASLPWSRVVACSWRPDAALRRALPVDDECRLSTIMTLVAVVCRVRVTVDDAAVDDLRWW